MDYLILMICIVVSGLLLYSSRTSKMKLPPGPPGLPIVGNLFDLGSLPHRSLAKLAKLHGPVMCLRMGRLRVVVISSDSAAKEVLQTSDTLFCNRFVYDSLTASQHHTFSMALLPPTALWKSLRKISASQLFTNARMNASQHLRRKQLEDLLSYVESCSRSGTAINIAQAAFNTSVNLLSKTFFSVDLIDPSSSNSVEFKEMVWQIMLESGTPNLADYFPVLRRIDPQGNRRRMKIQFEKILDLFNTMIRQRLDEKGGCFDEINDTLDALLKINQDNSEELDLSVIPHLLLDLFVGGSESTSSTVEWAMALLFSNPEKMKKAKEELETVVGKGIAVKEEDTGRLPYLQAAIKETFRMHPPTPFLIPRKTDSDVDLCGFTVQKGSQVIVNAWAIGRDPSLWENADTFEPERFLGMEIDVKGRNFELIPFGAGRRICPGLPIAMRMLTLMVANLINCFEWRLEGGAAPETLDMSDKIGFTLQRAHPFRVIPTSIIQGCDVSTALNN
uniref:Drimenol monooxygenase n=1 Tax=Persicaria hydropiper TaxID=46901 RepID=DOX1_PERHD|nr:RecName: Full=Drimenol monooxygenase; AltName: Full=Cytochrome P450 76AJ1; AltName: Full=Drimenol oxidase 1; Short=PhDOX1 [Persicaria hydropiper]AHF22835.1 drimenol oxidase 1 [Persicaria hydropiper]